MDLDDQISLGHFLLNDRTCKVCGETKNLVEDFTEQEKTKDLWHHLMHMSVKSVQRREFEA